MNAHRTLIAIALSALSGCHRVPRRAPARATDAIAVPAQESNIAVPISADLPILAAGLDRALPAELWTVDKPDQVCAASKRVKVLFAKIKTPTIKCRIVGEVTHGPMTIAGAGQTIAVTIPIHAVLSGRDIGGVLKQETAQADARVRVVAHIGINRDWSLKAALAISYDWTDEPHIDFLGQRIIFPSKADTKLKDVIAKLERTLPNELAKLRFPDKVDQAWRSAFTSLKLNDNAPQVWMRITPRSLGYGGYVIEQNRLTLKLGMTAETESFIGPRPPDPNVTALPAMRAQVQARGSVIFAIPVIADYRELEPVLGRALAKRSLRPFDVPGVGSVAAQFGRVVVYGTTGGRIAVGLTFSAARQGDTPSRGTIWLTALPSNAANSREIHFADLRVAGVTNSTGASLLIKLANAPGLADTIADSLTQNFSKDYAELIAKITRAIAEKHQGDLIIRARVTDVQTGQIKAAGQGIFIPVTGRGSATVELQGGS